MLRSFRLLSLTGIVGASLILAELSQAQLRVVQWNITNYGSTTVRDAAFKTALFGTFEGRSAKPDVFIAEEILSAASLTSLVSLMNSAPGSPGDYVGAPFVDGPDTDTVLVYRTSRVSLIGSPVVVSVGGPNPNHPRNIMRYDVQIVGYTGLKSQISIYGSHMKAGTTTSPSDEARRKVEADIIRANAETLGGRPFLLGGDLNTQNSSDDGFADLTVSAVNNTGRFFDPIKTPGGWYNNSSMKFVHTQDPAVGQAGMDDRFDFLLVNIDLIDGVGLDYIGNSNIAYSTTTWNDPNHSYRCWGNDGTSFNVPIKITGNTMVGTTIAQALNDSCGGQSGHLPVLFDLKVPAKISGPSSIDFGRRRWNSNATLMMTINNVADVAKWNVNGIANLKLTMSASSGFSVPSGQFTIGPAGTMSFPVTMDTTTGGNKNGSITIASDDPGQPSLVIPVSGSVLFPILSDPAG